MYVKWGSTMSSKFQVTNGVRQGGVLSPLLFDVYVNELSELLNKSGIGGNLGGTLINHMLYADDICIVSLSSSGLQHLLNQGPHGSLKSLKVFKNMRFMKSF